MPQDFFQIAREHHHAGRLSQARQNYQAALEQNPGEPEAMHWLGVLLFQAGQIEEAIALLEQAHAVRPDDAAFAHNFGQACVLGDRLDDAIAAFQSALRIEPARTQTRIALAEALLRRQTASDPQTALALLRELTPAPTDSVEYFCALGLALVATGRAAQAAEVFAKALSLRPHDAHLLYHQGSAARIAGDVKQARRCFNKVLESDVAHAPAWCGLAMLEMDAGRFGEAATFFRRAVNARPQSISAHNGLISALARAGKTAEAEIARQNAMILAGDAQAAPAPSIADYEKRLSSEDQVRFHFAMSSVAGVFSPTRVPRASIENLFDRYAPQFDQHLRDGLEYRVPEIMADALKANWDGRLLDILDLGCGTGLCGPLLRPMARRLVGVDLSSAMVEEATKRAVYDRVILGDLLDELNNAPPRSWDMLVAADVFIYVGDLTPVMEAVSRALLPGGRIAFSVEAGPGERFTLNPSTRRFTHSQTYLARLAQMHGFTQKLLRDITIRQQSNQPVPGYLMILENPA